MLKKAGLDAGLAWVKGFTAVFAVNGFDVVFGSAVATEDFVSGW